MHKLLPILTVAIGLVLMIFKIYADSEPGAIPLLLVILGVAWYLIGRLRAQSHQR
jgi:hypothetical protein